MTNIREELHKFAVTAWDSLSDTKNDEKKQAYYQQIESIVELIEHPEKNCDTCQHSWEDNKTLTFRCGCLGCPCHRQVVYRDFVCQMYEQRTA